MEFEEKTNIDDQTFKFFINGMKDWWQLLGNQQKAMTAVFGWIIFSQLLDISFPFIIKLMFDEIENFLLHSINYNYLLLLIAAVFIIKTGKNYLDRFSIEPRFLKSLLYLENEWPIQAQKKLLDLPISYHEIENTGKKIQKINKGCDRLTDITGRLRWHLLPELSYLVINIIFVFAIDWRLGLIFLFPFIPGTYINVMCWKKVAHAWEEWDTNKEVSTGIMCQSIINVRTVQNFVQERREKESFSKIRKYMEKIDVEASLLMQKYFFAMNFIMSLFFILTIFTALYLAMIGETSIGTAVFIIATGNVTFGNLWGVIHEYTEINRRIISVTKMKELLNEKSTICNSEECITPKKYVGNIEFNNISFTYPRNEKSVLNNFKFNITPNQMIAIAGKSGEGKTTIFKLLCRMYDVSQGKITLDGRNIKDIDLYWYRRLFAIVQQDVDIFDASIAENIRYANHGADDEMVIEAIRAAYLDDILSNTDKFPNGIDTEVGERGVKLSGGERQRVGIARAYLAMLSGAKILILDEATSNLDSQAERAIQEMIEKLRRKNSITIIACAHRLSTIQKSDIIYVVNKGSVVEKGDHNSLLRRNGLYKNLSELQKIGELRE